MIIQGGSDSSQEGSLLRGLRMPLMQHLELALRERMAQRMPPQLPQAALQHAPPAAIPVWHFGSADGAMIHGASESSQDGSRFEGSSIPDGQQRVLSASDLRKQPEPPHVPHSAGQQAVDLDRPLEQSGSAAWRTAAVSRSIRMGMVAVAKPIFENMIMN